LESGVDEDANASDLDSDESRLRKRNMDKILDSLESGSDGSPARVRLDLSQLRNLLASVRGVVDRPTRQRLVRLLITIDPRWAGYAGTVVGELQPEPDTIRDLLKILKSADYTTLTHRGVLNALWGMPAEDASGELLSLLGTGREEEGQIVKAIGHIGVPESMHDLVDWLDREINDKTRIQIEKALTSPAGAEALKQATENLASASPQRQLSILRVVSRIGGEEHSQALRALLAHNLDSETRRTAIRALGAMGDEESGRTLWQLSRSGSTSDKRDAARAMSRIKDRSTIEALLAEADYLDLGTKRALLEAGSTMRRPGPQLVELAESELMSKDRQVRLSAIAVVGESRQDRLLDKLIHTFKERKDKQTREAVMEALLVVKTREATRLGLVTLGSSGDAALRRAYLKLFEDRLKEFAPPDDG